MARTLLRYVSLMILNRICSVDKLAEDLLLARTNQLKELLPAVSLDLFKRMPCSDASLIEDRKCHDISKIYYMTVVWIP